MKLILASQSPRRVELLKQIYPDFLIKPACGPEIIPENAAPWEVVQQLAKGKAEEIAAQYPQDLVIGADTVVAVEQQILGKPKNHEQCVEMLRLLSGRCHQVYTGVALALDGKTETFYDVTQVEFYPLREEEIQWYASLDEPYDKTRGHIWNRHIWEDKAGGYGIQTVFGAKFVKRIEGDYNNVVGLPVSRLYQEMKKLNLI